MKTHGPSHPLVTPAASSLLVFSFRTLVFLSVLTTTYCYVNEFMNLSPTQSGQDFWWNRCDLGVARVVAGYAACFTAIVSLGLAGTYRRLTFWGLLSCVPILLYYAIPRYCR